MIESLNYCFDTIAITESWLDNFSAPVKGYNMFSLARESDRWSDVCFLCKTMFYIRNCQYNAELWYL